MGLDEAGLLRLVYLRIFVVGPVASGSIFVKIPWEDTRVRILESINPLVGQGFEPRPRNRIGGLEVHLPAPPHHRFLLGDRAGDEPAHAGDGYDIVSGCEFFFDHLTLIDTFCGHAHFDLLGRVRRCATKTDCALSAYCLRKTHKHYADNDNSFSQGMNERLALSVCQ